MASAFRAPFGETSFDTKSDLAVDPGAFLERSLHLWNGDASFGELQNQAYGYLFPQGSFAWLGQLLGVPAWVTQRVWVAVVLVLAYEGVRRLFLALPRRRRGPYTDAAAVLAGLAYAAAPRVGGIAGVISSEVTPPAMLPWAVLAIVSYATGRITARTAGLAAGVAILLMGGVNAVAVLACLPVIALAVIGAVPAGSRRPVALWTVLGVGAAVLWWLVPLVVLGRYSPSFLDFIETADATTAPLGWANAVRGAVHWVAFTSTAAGPSWPGAYGLHATALGVLLTWSVAIVALLGLTHRDMPYRRMLVGSLCLGIVALTIAHADALQGPLSGPVRWLLDRQLAMLRNVHKIDPLVRLPLALGFGHAVVVGVTWVRGMSPAATRGAATERVAVRVLCVALAVVAVAPLAVAPARTPGWREFPRAWTQAAEYVKEHRPSGTTLLLPAIGFGEQTWGRTVDEPFQSVARTGWVSRSQVPLTPPQTIRFLDAVIARTEDAGSSATLAKVLARAGISTIVLRHDLAPEALDPEVTRRVQLALDQAPGITREASFGVPAGAVVDVYGVDRGAPAVDAVETGSLAWVRGGAEDVVAAVESGVLEARRPAVMMGDAGVLESARDGASPDVVGDGQVRRERAFGLVRESVGPVLGTEERFTTRRPVHDYPGTPGTPLGYAEFDGISGVQASSSTASAESVGPVRPDQGAAAAIDGDLATAWRSSAFSRPLDQWWEVDLGKARAVDSVALVAGVNPFNGVPIRRLTVTTDDGQSVRANVHPETGRATAVLSGAAVSRIRVAVDAVAGAWSRATVGLVEVGIPGVDATRRVVVPAAAADADTSFVFRTEPSRRACVIVSNLPSCDVDAVRGQEEGGAVNRRFTVDEPMTARVTARVRAVAGSSTAALFDPLGDALTVRADSVLADDPAVIGAFAMDGDASTHWVAQPLARSATLTLSTEEEATISAMSVDGTRSVATLPARAVVSNGTTSHRVTLDNGSAAFPPLSGTRFTVTLGVGADDALAEPLGVGELVVEGLEDRVYRQDLDSTTGAPCGLGPQLLIDGRRYDTRVSGTLRAVRNGDPLAATVCDGSVQIGGGEHVLEWRAGDRFEVTAVSVSPSGSSAIPVARRSAGMTVADPAHRVVQLGSGGEAVLRVAQNFNSGWRAELDGRRLPALRVDGWQQGFVVPAGAGGEVQLVFEPDATYRRALLLGAVVALLLVLAAAASATAELRRHRGGAAPATARRPPTVTTSVAEPRQRVGAASLYAGFVAACLLLGGVAATAGALSWAWPAVRRRAGLLAAGTLVMAAACHVVWVLTGGSAVSTPVVVDLAVGMALVVLVARTFCVPGPWARVEDERE